MSTNDDLEKAQDAGIKSAEARALLEEAVRGVRRIGRRLESEEGSSEKRDAAIIRIEARVAALEDQREQSALADAGLMLREKALTEREAAAEKRAAARAAENRENRFRALAIFVAALIGVAARFYTLGGHHP